MNFELMLETAVARILTNPFGLTGLYAGHSGGKDSVVIAYLASVAARTANHTINWVHTPKSNTHPDTVLFLYKEALRYDALLHCIPQNQHAQVCSALGLRTQIDGSRIHENNRSDGRSTVFEQDGKAVSRTELPLYVPNGQFGINCIHPIYDWTDDEVWAFIEELGLHYSPEYN